MRRTEVAGEDYAFALPGLWVSQIDFNVGRSENMASTLQPYAGLQLIGIGQGEPLLVRQCNDPLLDEADVFFDLCLVTAETKFESIFQHYG